MLAIQELAAGYFLKIIRILTNAQGKPALVAQTYNSSTREAEAERSCIQGQTSLHNEILSPHHQKNKTKKNQITILETKPNNNNKNKRQTNKQNLNGWKRRSRNETHLTSDWS